jgi:hypothetical protein
MSIVSVGAVAAPEKRFPVVQLMGTADRRMGRYGGGW